MPDQSVEVAEFLTQLCLEEYLRVFPPGTTMETIRSMPTSQMLALGLPRGHAVRVANLAQHWNSGNTAMDAALQLGLRGTATHSTLVLQPQKPYTTGGLSSFTRRLAMLHVNGEESPKPKIPAVPSKWQEERQAKLKGQARKRCAQAAFFIGRSHGC